MSYVLGKHSKAELVQVHPDLVAVVKLAIVKTSQDFTVHDGIRTEKEQRIYYETNVSQIMDSMHLPQQDDLGHAVELVPYMNGKLRWELGPCYVIAKAVREAAWDLSVDLRWGGSWDALDDAREPGLMVEEYIAKRRRQGRRVFVDAVHYELIT